MEDKKQKHHDDCGCESSNCHCGDDCTCTEEENCGCDCWKDKPKKKGKDKHEKCDCGCDHEMSVEEQFKAYQHAFDQFEAALEKVDKELENEKARAKRLEMLADNYKKDLDRYKERTKNIESDAKNQAVMVVAKEIIPVLDNFEQAFRSVTDESIAKGFKMIELGIGNILSNMGVEEMKCEGEVFDPNFHEAINRIVTSDKKKAGKVASVYKKGYVLKGDEDKVIRHAQVQVYTQQES